MAPSVDLSSSIIVTKEGGNISPSLTVVNVSRPGTADNMIQYQCTASNGVDTPATATVNVTVECK